MCRSKPVTYFAEKDRLPITLDEILKDYYNRDKTPKRKIKRRVKTDKKLHEIKKNLDCGRMKPKITKRVENFIYLSKLLNSYQSKAEKVQVKETSSNFKSKKRPLTSRGNRIRICTDMRIMSLASNSPERLNTAQSKSRGKATFYTESKSPSTADRKSNYLFSEHKMQAKTRNNKNRPFTARLVASKEYKTQASIGKVLH